MNNLEYSIVVPVFNSEQTLEELFLRIKTVFQDLKKTFQVIFVEDDGNDNSWNVLVQLKEKYPDIITAIKRAIERSPSEKFQEFLQGITGTLTAGGQLKTYLSGRAEHYMRENRREQKELIESIGVLAESYIVVGVAMPLFLIIMLVVMSWIGGMAALSSMMFILVVFLVLPIIHAGYAGIIYMVAPKV